MCDVKKDDILIYRDSKEVDVIVATDSCKEFSRKYILLKVAGFTASNGRSYCLNNKHYSLTRMSPIFKDLYV